MKTRGQAAIFDGIMFLLLVSFSVALMFSFLSDYGANQAHTLRNSHLLNYVQGIGKSVYNIDVSTLKTTDLNTVGQRWSFDNCDTLGKFRLNTVADLLKRDLSDHKFNNKFGDSEVANAPGKLALRCALFELMKPVVGSGYDYQAEILDADSTPLFAPFQLDTNDPEPRLVTTLAESDPLYQVAKVNGCESIALNLKGKQLLAISTPFKVFDEAGQAHGHQLRICMWPSEST